MSNPSKTQPRSSRRPHYKPVRPPGYIIDDEGADYGKVYWGLIRALGPELGIYLSALISMANLYCNGDRNRTFFWKEDDQRAVLPFGRAKIRKLKQQLIDMRLLYSRMAYNNKTQTTLAHLQLNHKGIEDLIRQNIVKGATAQNWPVAHEIESTGGASAQNWPVGNGGERPILGGNKNNSIEDIDPKLKILDINRAQKSASADSVALVDVSQSDSMGNQHVPNEQDQAPNKDWKDPLDEFQDHQGAPAAQHNNDPCNNDHESGGMLFRGHHNLGPPPGLYNNDTPNLERNCQRDKISSTNNPSRERKRAQQ